VIYAKFKKLIRIIIERWKETALLFFLAVEEAFGKK